MPIYEYRCKACDHETEALQKMSDKPLRKCPECGRMQLQRQISAPVFRLKGGGWYETDFKSDKETKRNIAGEADKSPPEKPAEAASATDKPAEQKPADKKAASGSSDAGTKPGKKTGKKDSSSAVA